MNEKSIDSYEMTVTSKTLILNWGAVKPSRCQHFLAPALHGQAAEWPLLLGFVLLPALDDPVLQAACYAMGRSADIGLWSCAL